MKSKNLNPKNISQLKSWLVKLETYGTSEDRWSNKLQTEYQALQAYLLILETDLKKLPHLYNSLPKLEKQLLQTWKEENDFDLTLQQFCKEDFTSSSALELNLINKMGDRSLESIVQSNLKLSSSTPISLFNTIKQDIKSLFQDLFPKRERWVSLPLVVTMSLLLFTFSWSYVPSLFNISNAETSIEADILETITISDSITFLSSELWTNDFSKIEE